jgi:hypothetical protein
MKILGLLNTFIFLAALGVFTSPANSADRILIDEGDTNMAFSPMYARVMDNLESEYVPVAFYRNPECVNPSFDLLLYYDIPGAFFCLPLMAEGFAIFEDRENNPFDPPIQSKLKGDSVPFVFVERETYNMIAADGLTIGDLRDYGIWGTATSFKEELQPTPPGLLNIVAEGMRDDGVPFRFRLTSQFFEGDVIPVVIAERVFSLKFD